MQLPFVQNHADRTIGNCFSFLGGGDLAEALLACTRYAPKVKNSLPKPSRRGSVARARAAACGVLSARRHANLLTQRELGPTQIVQPAEGKRAVAQSQP